LGWLVRERGLLDLNEAIRRSTLLPALTMQDAAPALRRKGRIQVGCDADILVFDPVTVGGRATFSELVPAAGVDHLLVNGQFVIRDGTLDLDARPGRAVRAAGGAM
jgi:N-acyl-D-aspartate/D-glutamate deacylase